MRISVVLILVVTTVNVIGRPHNDGTAHTHTPVVAPDSESVINIEGHNEAAVHHSDVGLGNYTKSSHSDLSYLGSGQSEIVAAATHHSDSYLNGPEKKTLKPPKPTVGSGHAPIIHVDNSGKTGDHLTVDGKTSVVSHGPMAKNLDNPENKQNHDHEHEHGSHGHDGKHSTVNHAPMATEHHPSTGAAHHPQLSKTEPAIAHAPMVHPEDDHKTDKTDDSLDENSAVVSTVHHPPLATDHNSSKTKLAHHPSLSKIDPPLSHAPIAIPHGSENPDEAATRRKRSKGSNQNSYAKKRTTSTTTSTTTTSAVPRESGEDYTESEEYPSKEEPVREKRSKGSNQKSYARKTPATTTTTTTTTLATPTDSDSTVSTLIGSSEEHESQEKTSEIPEIREKRSKGTNQKSYVKKTTTTSTTTPPPPPTPKETFEASHRGSSEEQDDKQVRDKKPEESEFREKRSKGSNRKAYSRTTPKTTTVSSVPPESTTVSAVVLESSKATRAESSDHPESHEHSKDDGSPFSPKRDKRSKGSQGSQRKSYARTTPTTTTVTTPSAPTTQDSSDSTPLESSEGPENHNHKPEETEIRARRSHNKGGNNHFAKNPLTTRNYPTVSSTEIEGSDDIMVRSKRSKGNYQKQQPRKTTITTTTVKPTTAIEPTTFNVSEIASEGSSESVSLTDVVVTSEKTVRIKRAKGSQSSYAKKQHITTTVAPKAPEPEAPPASNVHHPSLSKTEPLLPGKPEEPKNSKPETINPVTVPESGKPAQPPQIIPGSHPLAIPLPTNPPTS